MDNAAVNSRSASSCQCEVRPVSSRLEMRDFKRLPLLVCGRQREWVQPLKIMQNWILNRRRHPFYEGGSSAKAEFFLARNAGGQPVGRIAAIINHRYDQHIRQRDAKAKPSGLFGFFDCVNSGHVAKCLLEAAADWLRRRGIRRMLGPASPSQAYEYGVLVEGHDRPHRFLLAYNPPYYADLLDGAGLEKAKDLLTFSMDMGEPRSRELLERFFALSDAASAALPKDVTIRSVDKQNLDAEVRIACSLFNQILSDHWGYSPITDGELRHMARSLRRFLIPDSILIAEQGGNPIGVALGVPDLNEIIRRLKVRIGWIEPLELLLRARRWRPKCVRVVAVGVIPGHDRAGVALAMVGQLTRNILAHGICQVEAHLVLEDNRTILNPLRRYGLHQTRKHRIYRLDL